jgi:PPOX class probable F420-dependent enzyme
MTPAERARVAAARVGRLATVRPDGTPHLVVVTFALYDDSVVTAVDDKPKRTQDLQRLTNLESNPAATLLVDHYDEDWSALWWIRLDGHGYVVRDEPRRTELLAPLVAKYEQYRLTPPTGPVIVLDIRSTTSWSASPEPAAQEGSA